MASVSGMYKHQKIFRISASERIINNTSIEKGVTYQSLDRNTLKGVYKIFTLNGTK